MSINYYTLLKIAPTATKTEIEDAIIRAQASGSIDKGILTGARNILLNKDKRKIYDINIVKVLPPEPKTTAQAPVTLQTTTPINQPELCDCANPLRNTQTGFCIQCGKKLHPPRAATLFRQIC